MVGMLANRRHPRLILKERGKSTVSETTVGIGQMYIIMRGIKVDSSGKQCLGFLV